MSRLTDMNDLHQVKGKAAVKKTIEQAKPVKPAIDQHQAGMRPEPYSRLKLIKASSVQPEPIRWLMQGRIALGKLTLIAGDPGLGKSMLTANFAAHVSRGKDWPAGLGSCPQGDVLFVSAEDDPADTIRPRLDAAGADVERVHIVAGVQSLNSRGDIENRLLSLRKDRGMMVATQPGDHHAILRTHHHPQQRARLP